MDALLNYIKKISTSALENNSYVCNCVCVNLCLCFSNERMRVKVAKFKMQNLEHLIIASSNQMECQKSEKSKKEALIDLHRPLYHHLLQLFYLFLTD